MPHARSNLLCCIVIAGLLTMPLPASATSRRTFVASTGNDANPCTLALPCRTFATAVAQADAGGEVIVVDSAGYGPVTITKSISIIAPPGVYGGITVPSGTEGIWVDGAGIAVVVRGLTINGGGSGTGIFAPQGSRLTIEDCEIGNLANGIGISANSTVTVRHTVVRDVLYGFATNNSVDATLDGVYIFAKNTGVLADTIFLAAIARLTVANSVIMMSSGGSGVSAKATNGSVDIMVTHSTISGGDNGVVVSALPGHTARLASDGNAINNAAAAAFYFVGNGGTEIINTSGTNTVGFTPAIVLGGALTLIGQH